ncbi:MAG: ABC transporter ATP-binding protein [Bryobacteraceae bacterium]
MAGNANTTEPPSPGFSMAGYRRALRYALPHWKRFTFVFGAGIAATLFGLAQPYISKLLIDEALLRRDFHKLVTISSLMVVATLASFALNIASSYQYIQASSGVLFGMRLALYRHLQQLSPRFWSRNKMGDIISRINNDISEVQRVTADSLLGALSNVVFLIGSAGIMATLNRKLLVLSVAVLPISLWALTHYQKRLADRVRAVRERSASIGSFLLETLLGMRVVVASGAESREVARFGKENQNFVDALLHMQMTSFMAGAVPGALLTLCTSAIFLYGGKMVIDGEITTGSLVAIMAYQARLLAPLQNLMGLYTNMISGGVSLNRVCELLDTPAEVVQRPEAVAVESVKGEIEIAGVSFRHGEKQVLNELSFRVPAGTICAVLGPSGSGKSTLADLLVRFYDPDQGTIKLDGQDLRDLHLNSLRRSVVLLDQSPYLFQASVRENIAYARPEATEEEIITAARAASIHDRIVNLPEGYATVLAERGQTLSVGERQRIALARALLAEPKVLILDEPTAALDEANELSIVETLSTALVGRTAIIITHGKALTRIAHQTVTLA